MSWLIEYFSFEWIFQVVSQVIIGECDNPVRVEFIFDQNLISMINVRLMPIIGICVGTSHKDRPILRRP